MATKWTPREIDRGEPEYRIINSDTARNAEIRPEIMDFAEAMESKTREIEALLNGRELSWGQMRNEIELALDDNSYLEIAVYAQKLWAMQNKR